LLLSSCDGAGFGAGDTSQASSASAAVASDDRGEGGRTWALLINGGGSAERNYQSHVLHLRELIDLLGDRHIDGEYLSVFASDGAGPAADMAVLESSPDDEFWMLEGLAFASRLRPQISLADTRIDGVVLHPATRAALGQWFEQQGSRLRSGDSLLIYVTDHGWRNPSDSANNAIVLWGERLTVNELSAMMRGLAPGVRVVMLMSQCFSGSFANAAYAPGAADVCGYFSSSADRYAYGCYAENRGKKNIGHSFRFVEGLRGFGNFPQAHRRVLLSDRTPDVPNRSSDHYLERLLRERAQQAGVAFESLVDELLKQAWKDDLHYASMFALIDRIGEVYGAFGPRTLSELSARSLTLRELSGQLDDYARSWRRSLLDLERENFQGFIRDNPHWAEFVDAKFLSELDLADKRRIRQWLLADLLLFTDSDPQLRRRMRLLRKMSKQAAAARYRMEVRLGAALRMRNLLIRIAGLVHLDRDGSNEQHATCERLDACENFAFSDKRTSGLARSRMPEPYPPLAKELELLGALLPGWLGIEYRWSGGGAEVTAVHSGSPAARAGLAKGDVILGPPGAHFSERNQLREWIVTSLVDELRQLELRRGDTTRIVDLRIGAEPSNP